MFDRYNIVSEDDIAAAIESTTSYVARERQKRPRVEPLRRANTHSRARDRAGARARVTVTARNRKCREGGSNSHAACAATDFKCLAGSVNSTNFQEFWTKCCPSVSVSV